jgi:hypothetical protein
MNISDRTGTSARAGLGRIVLSLLIALLAVSPLAIANADETALAGASTDETLTTWAKHWISGMLERKTVKYKFKLTAVALANKVARIVFALMTRGGQYDDRPVTA